MSQPQVSRWESGDVAAGADDALKLVALAKEMGVHVEHGIPKPTAKAQNEALDDAAQPVLIVSGDRRHESHLPDPDLERREAAAADLQAKEDGEAGKRK